jgi:hypothetical protein
MFFFFGLTDRRKFFWIIQLLDHTVIENRLLEYIQPQALGLLISQKIGQLQTLITSEFTARLQAHLIKTERNLFNL